MIKRYRMNRGAAIASSESRRSQAWIEVRTKNRANPCKPQWFLRRQKGNECIMPISRLGTDFKVVGNHRGGEHLSQSGTWMHMIKTWKQWTRVVEFFYDDIYWYLLRYMLICSHESVYKMQQHCQNWWSHDRLSCSSMRFPAKICVCSPRRPS